MLLILHCRIRQNSFKILSIGYYFLMIFDICNIEQNENLDAVVPKRGNGMGSKISRPSSGWDNYESNESYPSIDTSNFNR